MYQRERRTEREMGGGRELSRSGQGRGRILSPKDPRKQLWIIKRFRDPKWVIRDGSPYITGGRSSRICANKVVQAGRRVIFRCVPTASRAKGIDGTSMGACGSDESATTENYAWRERRAGGPR